MRKTTNRCRIALLTLALAWAAAGRARGQPTGFAPGKLAVLRVGDGAANGGSSDFSTHQNPVFIDQYDRDASDQARPSFSAAIPSRGPNALWINGNAGTEGGMERSGDHSVLTVPGYCGDILSLTGTPSRLSYDRGICVVDSRGTVRLAYKGTKWYGLFGDKSNPRDAVSDGAGGFWGAGSEMGTLFYNGGVDVLPLKSAASTRAVKIVNNTLYASMTALDGVRPGGDDQPGGVYGFMDSSRAPVALPKSAGAAMTPALLAKAPFTHIVGFDISPDNAVAYLADIVYGIQKYVKTGGEWRMAYDFYIPGYAGPRSGILTNGSSAAVRTGCFGLAVDFAGSHPVLYATTTDFVGYKGKNVNSNRLIRIDDTNAPASGATITNFAQTLATAAGTNISFRAVAFTPEAKP